MPAHVRVSGTWRQVLAGGFYVHASGAWRQVQAGYVRVAGVWRQFHQAAVFALPTSAGDTGFASGTNSAQATATFNTNGTFQTVGANDGVQESGNWVTPTSLAPGSYTIRASLSSGSTPSGSALDTDLALSTLRSWWVTQFGEGSIGCTLALTLKDGGGNTVASGSLSLGAQVLPF